MDYYQTSINYKLNSQLLGEQKLDLNNFVSSNNDSSCDELLQIIKTFDRINVKEIEPTTKNIHKNIFEEDLVFVIDEVVNLIFKELNEGKEQNVIKQHVIDYINKISPQEVYNWLMNNQINSNSIYLFGYFNYHGIGTDINKQKAFELIQKAAELENNLAQLDLSSMYIHGKDVDKDYNIAFELSKKLAERENPNAMNRLGYCFEIGIGTDVNLQMAFEMYQKAANLGNIIAQCNLGLFYKNGKAVAQNNDKAFELFKKSSEGGFSGGISMLGRCYYMGVGTSIDKQKAFELYQKAANMGNYISQYNLANMYVRGDYVEKDFNRAIYCFLRKEQGAPTSNKGAFNVNR
ncbi:kinase-like domain-containing protein [Rhizophagus irregularis DAOM 181602=DAOM 197198]|nr:kinase-like domain-containing protein [Rhizophagus irregularis DAOM 181602=DAOM 197198]